MNSPSPAVSLIIPCRNEKSYIETCLRSLLAQEVPSGDFEVIVADGMSTDGTRDLLKRLSAEEPRLRLIDNPRQITPCGMNAGVKAARGRYIAIMGAHNRYAPDYVCRSVEALKETGADNVGGAMECEAVSYTQRAIAAAYHSPFSAGGARWHNPAYEGPADTVFGGVYCREVFDRIGFFDEELVRNQDDEFNLRLTRAGGKIWQSPRIRSWYHPRNSLIALFRQYTQYGYWKVRVIQKHKLPASVRHLVPGLFVFTLLVLPLVGLWWPLAAWGWLGLLGTYVVSNLTASVLTAARSEWILFPLLPVVFACYHFAYGYGFLRGIWDFVLWRRGPNTTYSDITRTISHHVTVKTTRDR
jgi:glycosyltransferase involved in cell wall biosynthesis